MNTNASAQGREDVKEGQIVSAFDESTWNDKERSYFESVDVAMREKLSIPFNNGRPLHAVYLIYNFFLYAQREIRLFSDSLLRKATMAPDEGMLVYSDPHVLDAVKCFLEKSDVRLKMIVSKDVDESMETHPLLNMIESLKREGVLKGQCTLHRLDEKDLRIMEDREKYFNLLLMDDKAYRIELVPGTAKSYVCANDEKMTRKLTGVFDRLYDSGKFLWECQPAIS